MPGDKKTAQLASEYKVHAGQVTVWKKQLLSGAASLFEDRRGRKPDEGSADEVELFEQIGRLKMELEWLKQISPIRLRRVANGSNRIIRS